MSECRDERGGCADERAKAPVGAIIARWFWILFLSFIAFWPIRGCVNEKTRAEDGGYGYGRHYDLSQIAKAIYTYAEGHNEQLPPTLWALYPTYIDTPRVLISPADLDPENSGGWLHRYIYLYEGGADSRALPPNAPIVVYPYESYGGEIRYSVLFADGHVRGYYSQAELLDAWPRQERDLP